MCIVLAKGYEGDFGLVFEFMNEPAESEKISMLGEILFHKEESSFFKEFSLVLALAF